MDTINSRSRARCAGSSEQARRRTSRGLVLHHRSFDLYLLNFEDNEIGDLAEISGVAR